jgi:hypothetical protein
MADNPRGFSAKTNLAGGMAMPMWEGLLLSNQGIANGDILFASAGYLRGSATTDKLPVGVAVTTNATSVTTNPKILFYPAIDSIVFTGQCSGTPTQATIWTVVDYEGASGASAGVATRSIQEINEDATTNKQLNIIGLDPQSSMGANVELLFIFARSKFTAKTWDSAGPAV